MITYELKLDEEEGAVNHHIETDSGVVIRCYQDSDYVCQSDCAAFEIDTDDEVVRMHCTGREVSIDIGDTEESDVD